MSSEITSEDVAGPRTKLIEALKLEFPEHPEKVEAVVDEFLCQTIALAANSFADGVNTAEVAFKKSSKVTYFIRTFASVLCAPFFIKFAQSIAGEGLGSMILAALTISIFFLVGDELCTSLWNQFNRK